MIVLLTRSNIVQTPSHSKMSKIQWKISSREDLLLFGASGRQIKDFTELNLTNYYCGSKAKKGANYCGTKAKMVQIIVAQRQKKGANWSKVDGA